MLSFLRRWLRLRGRKDIYRYWDGVAWRYADPMALWARLEKEGGDNWLESLKTLHATKDVLDDKLSPELLKAKRDVQQQAADEICELGVKVLGAVPLDEKTGKGLTIAQTIWLVTGFFLWMQESEEAARPSPSSPERTGASPADSSGTTE